MTIEVVHYVVFELFNARSTERKRECVVAHFKLLLELTSRVFYSKCNFDEHKKTRVI